MEATAPDICVGTVQTILRHDRCDWEWGIEHLKVIPA